MFRPDLGPSSMDMTIEECPGSRHAIRQTKYKVMWGNSVRMTSER